MIDVNKLVEELALLGVNVQVQITRDYENELNMALTECHNKCCKDAECPHKAVKCVTSCYDNKVKEYKNQWSSIEKQVESIAQKYGLYTFCYWDELSDIGKCIISLIEKT